MDLIFPGNLTHRFEADQGVQPDLGLEGSCVPLPFGFAHSPVLLACPTEPEKSNLAAGPNFGVHYCVLPTPEAIVRTKTSVFGGGYYSHGKQFLEELPIPTINFDTPTGVKEQDSIVSEVKKLIAMTDAAKKGFMTPATQDVVRKQIEMARDALECHLNNIFGLTTKDFDVIRSVPIPE